MISLDISATIGALEWGALVSVFLFGIETCQSATKLNHIVLLQILTHDRLHSLHVLETVSSRLTLSKIDRKH